MRIFKMPRFMKILQIKSPYRRAAVFLCAFTVINFVILLERMKSPIFHYGKESLGAKYGHLDPGGGKGSLDNTLWEIISSKSKKETIKVTGVVNPHNYQFTINEPHICNEPNISLIIVVCTGVTNFEERQTIRQTWGSYIRDPKLHSKMVFFVGATKDIHTQEQLRNESKHHRDIIQENFIDSYRNLSIKSVGMLKWTSQFCDNSKYLLKTDDDMFINVPNLLKSLHRQNHSRFIMGAMITGARPIHNRGSKWYTTVQEYASAVYPKYMSGTAYAMTTNVTRELYESSLRTNFFWLEDIYITGLCARTIALRHIPNGGFTYSQRGVTGCAFRDAISGHRVTMNDMRTIYQQLHSSRLTC